MDISEITLVSFEGIEYKVPSLILSYSSVLNAIPNPNENIYLSNLEIDYESLELILDYYNHYKFKTPTVLKDNERNSSSFKLLPEWDIDFIKSINDEVLAKLLHCCVKLELFPLLDLICINLASRYKEKDEIEKQHKTNLSVYDTPECEIYMKNKYDWANK